MVKTVKTHEALTIQVLHQGGAGFIDPDARMDLYQLLRRGDSRL